MLRLIFICFSLCLESFGYCLLLLLAMLLLSFLFLTPISSLRLDLSCYLFSGFISSFTLKIIYLYSSSILPWKCLIMPLKLILLALLIALTVSSGIYRCLSNIFSYPVACIRSFFSTSNLFWISTYFDVYFLISYYFSLK